MIMEKEPNPQVCSNLCSCLLAPLVVAIALVFSVLFLFFFFFPLSGFSPTFLLTIPVALVSTLFLATLKKKKGSEEEDELHLHHLLQKNEQEVESQSNSSFPSDSDDDDESSSNNGGSAMDEKFELNSQNPSLPSDGFSINGSNLDESFELDDDEEEEEEEEDGLIEINLPLRSHFSGLTEQHDDDQKMDSSSNLPDFLPEAMFKQEGVMELLAEINEMNIEDDNLIEIDISMGSASLSSSPTSCQDLRLKQEMAFLND